MYSLSLSSKANTLPARKRRVKGPPRVLVVDDNDSLLQVLVELLSSSGFLVEAAANAVTGFQILDNDPVDLIVCDIMMPEVDGYEFFKQVRENSVWCHIPFVFLTALSGASEIRQGKELGCDDYVIKPFDPEDLVAVVKGKLSVSRRRETARTQIMDGFRRRVINTLSHEFRTPLVAIHTGSELLLDQHEDLEVEKMQKLIHSIHRSGQRLERLVSDFMTLQQIDSGTAKSTCEEFRSNVKVRSLFEYSADVLYDHIGKHASLVDIRFELDSLDPDGAIYVYEAQVADALCRLLNNAFKFGAKDAPIILKAESLQDTTLITVRDYGPGLPKNIVDDACGSFSQINRDKLEQQGCGLGLAIVSCYAEINNGKLTFENPDDGGLQVSLEFPSQK